MRGPFACFRRTLAGQAEAGTAAAVEQLLEGFAKIEAIRPVGLCDTVQYSQGTALYIGAHGHLAPRRMGCLGSCAAAWAAPMTVSPKGVVRPASHPPGATGRGKAQPFWRIFSTMAVVELFSTRPEHPYLAAVGLDDLRADHLLDAVIAALDQHVRTHLLEQALGSVFGEAHHPVHRAEPGEYRHAPVHRVDRPANALQASDRGVVVDPDDQAVALARACSR